MPFSSKSAFFFQSIVDRGQEQRERLSLFRRRVHVQCGLDAVHRARLRGARGPEKNPQTFRRFEPARGVVDLLDEISFRLLLAEDDVHRDQSFVLEKTVTVLDRLAGNDGALHAARQQHVVQQLKRVPGDPRLFLDELQVLGKRMDLFLRNWSAGTFENFFQRRQHRSPPDSGGCQWS